MERYHFSIRLFSRGEGDFGRLFGRILGSEFEMLCHEELEVEVGQRVALQDVLLGCGQLAVPDDDLRNLPVELAVRISPGAHPDPVCGVVCSCRVCCAL